MSLVAWTERMSVGVGQLDDEHKTLIAMANRLFEAAQAGQARSTLGPILEELSAYTRTHFAHEEAILSEFGYPELEHHRREHEQLAQHVADIQRRFQAGAGAMLGLEVMSFLKQWLVKHIQGTDGCYRSFLNDHGLH